MADGVFTATDRQSPSQVAVCWLPSRTQPQPRITVIEQARIGVKVAGLAIDPAQDLLAFVEFAEHPRLQDTIVSADGVIRIHLRSLRNGEPHPLTSTPLISRENCRLDSLEVQLNFQVADDVIGLSLASFGQESRILVWKWTTGSLLVVSADHSQLETTD